MSDEKRYPGKSQSTTSWFERSVFSSSLRYRPTVKDGRLTSERIISQSCGGLDPSCIGGGGWWLQLPSFRCVHLEFIIISCLVQ